MSLFQNSVLRLAIENLDLERVTKAFARYQTSFLPKIENIKKSKEEQYQYGFFQDLFVDVFSYVLNPSPDFNLTTEFKNLSDSKKVDGAVLVNGEVIAVIELKSTKTKSMQNIVNQAFNYKNNHPTCKYVITSNFEKLRFYIEHSNEFEEFNLFTLTLEKFTLLYLLLNVKDMLSLKALEVKKASKLKDEQISNELYKKYSQLRLDLFHNIKENNAQEPLLLLNLTQKILDRMIFIFFGEDRGILKPNTIQAIVDHHKDDIEDRSLYHFYKIYFKGINRGNKKLDIPEYNGGLFACDDVLDALVIDDDVLNALPLQLSAYDFNSDIDVDILGHIFENSLSDLEEIKASIEESDFDKSKTKRNKDGVFYTPEYITKYIVENTLGKLCTEKREALGLENIDVLIPKNPKKLNKGELKIKEALETYRAYLLELKIVDPACGSGAFLNQALNFLIFEHECIDENEKTLMGGNVLGLFDVKKEILEHNLFGVDINEESVEIAKLSLWLRTVERGRKLNKLANNIKVGNSLINDKSVVDNAFVWEDEFPEVFAKGGFDVVIGNPPYIRAQSLKSYAQEESTYYESVYQSAVGNYDIYVLFIEKSFWLLNQYGRLSYILPNKFLVAGFGKGIRQFAIENKAIESIVHFGSEMVFHDASAYTCILTISHQNKTINFKALKPIELFEEFIYDSIAYTELSSDNWTLGNRKIINIIKKMNEQPLQVKNKFEKIFQGLKTGSDNIFIMQGKVIDGIFHGYSDSLKKYVTIESKLIQPLLKGDDIDRYKYVANSYFAFFPYEMIGEKTIPMMEETIKVNYPKAYLYIMENSLNLRKREKGKFDNDKEWFLYSRNQGINYFNQPKIVFQEMGNNSKMSYDLNGYCVIRQYSMIKRSDTLESYKYFLSIFNSNLMWFYIKNTSTELRGGYFMYQTKYLEPFPLPILNKLEDQEPFIEKADQMLALNKAFQTKKEKFLNRLKTNLELEKLSKKLEAFYDYSFQDLLKELKKKKVVLNLNNQDEGEDYFNNYQKELLELKAQTDKTDKEIDAMVYELYGLSDEEIKIVEGAL